MNRYRGRFAPSPTGPMHFGSLAAAVASYLDARAHAGEWLVRIEDVDRPREIAGAATEILRTLEALGFEWSGPVLYQSTRAAAYDAALDALGRTAATYPCACTRKEVADSAITLGAGGEFVYPGTCASGLPPGKRGRSIRVRVGAGAIAVRDLLQGELRQSLSREIGDFVLRRADGCHAYQLAVVVDDAAQGITHVVRGADLLDSTPRQIHLQRLLGVATPAYLHVPAAVNAAGEKLSKRTQAAPITANGAAICAALRYLGQAPPEELTAAAPDEVWHWAIAHWARARLPRARSVVVN